MFWSVQHTCIVKRSVHGLYYAQCSCGYEGLALKSAPLASNAREHHLKGAMQADPMAKWSTWMTSELPEEPA